MRILIIEDEIAIRNDIKGLLSLNKENIVVAETGSIIEAKILIKTSYPDLVLLDINLEDGNAFELIKSLEKIEFKIIFITAYNEYAIRAIKLGALDYLLKPIDPDELHEALNKANTIINQREQINIVSENYEKHTERIVLRTSDGIYVFNVDEIVFCMSEGNYTYFYLVDDRKIIASKNIKEYDEILPNNKFVRCHQSYIVNISQIIKIDKDDNILLRDGRKIPVSKRKKEILLYQLYKN